MTKPNLKVISNKSSRLAEEIIMGRTPREITDRTLKPILSTLGMEITRYNTGSIREIKFRITNEEFLKDCLKIFNDLFVRPDETTADTSGAAKMDFCATGFKLRNSDDKTNRSGARYIFMAFSEQSPKTQYDAYTNAR